MAWLELKPSGYYHIAFRLGDQKLKRSLKTKNRHTAEGRLAGVEATLQVLESGRLSVPKGVDIVSFLLSDGRLSKSALPAPVLTISVLVSRFIEALPPHSMEQNSLATLRLHVRHICRIMGSKATLNALDLAALQRYVNQRSCEEGSRGKCVSAVTIRKEIASLRSVWNWGRTRDLIDRPFPSKGLRFPKTDEKPAFRTRNQIERLLETAHLTQQQKEELWDGLFLYPHEIEELLDIIAARSMHGFLLPMCAVASYTGTRRSELVRSRLEDLDFDARVITVRERKRVKGVRSLRTVPMTRKLASLLQPWLDRHPGGAHTFTLGSSVLRSRKTRSQPDRLTVHEATYHLQRTLSATKWSVLRGWHIFRHSFISSCAGQGIDQRMIDAWVGHQTDEMRRRYRHLFPDMEQRAIHAVFGD